ncbi:MAG: PAS domain S-box protein [Victivallaceae bacterium]
MTAKNKITGNSSSRLNKLQEELKQVSEALRQSENLFQALIKNIPGVVYLCNCDKYWTMHYIVKEIEKVTGYPASDFINNNVRSFASIIHPDDRALVEELVEKAISENKPYELEYRIVRKDGEIIWFHEKGQKVHSENGNIWLNGIMSDITKYKQNLMALDIAAEEWKTTFDSIPNAVFLLDKEGRIVKCNRAVEKLLKQKKNALIGQEYCEVICACGRLTGKKPFEKMLKSGRREKTICLFNDRIVEITVSPVVNSRREVYGFVILFVDITKLKNAEEQLKNKNKQLRSIFHTAPIGIGVVSRKAFVEVNEQMCEITGYGQKELLGKSPSLLHDDVKEFERVHAVALSPRGSKVAVTRTQLTRKDGRKVDVLLHFSSLNSKTNSFTFTMTDLSENK